MNDLQQANLFGEHDQEGTERLRARIETLKTRKTERLQELDLMMRLAANLPEVLTEAVVVPVPVVVVMEEHRPTGKGAPMRRDDEVEAIAMGITMQYERSRGWSPFDVSKDGEHYDIRSEGPGGEKRFIEVKGRAQTGAIILTGPELDKLRQLGARAWLYIVTFCKGERPRLRIIRDPISKLDTEMLYRQIQYLVAEKEWHRYGEELEFPVNSSGRS